MTCTAQKTINDSLLKLCTEANTSQASSTLLVKRLIATCISNITYLRLIFPEKCYIDQEFGNDNLVKIFDETTDNYGVQQHIKWLRGAFDALDHKYLKCITFAIYTDEDSPETSVVEMYKVSINYAEKSGEFEPELKLETADSVKTFDSIQAMLNTLILLTEDLEDFPADACMTMKLTYNKRTPKDYLPNGYVRDRSKLEVADPDKICIKVGSTHTNFHAVNLKAAFDSRTIGKNLKRSRDAEEMIHPGGDNQISYWLRCIWGLQLMY